MVRPEACRVVLVGRQAAMVEWEAALQLILIEIAASRTPSGWWRRLARLPRAGEVAVHQHVTP